jgi:hypothetical protein
MGAGDSYLIGEKVLERLKVVCHSERP